MRGNQRARVESVPPFVASTGTEALELLRASGVKLDLWQEYVLVSSLGESETGDWAAFEIGICCPRQSGKNEIALGRQIVGLYLLSEGLQVHSAHLFSASLEAFRRLLTVIESCPDLDQRVKRVSRSHGEEGIELLDGRRIHFRTRTAGGGRGFSADVVYADEAMILSEASHQALLPTMSARRGAQIWYLGSAVDKEVHPDGVVFSRIRERGLRGDDPSLCYFEWSIDATRPQEVSEVAASDPQSWAQSNPGMGIRITPEAIEREHRSLDPRAFAVERLGVGDWHRTDGHVGVIPPAAWEACLDRESTVLDPIALAFDTTPDRKMSTIACAGRRADGVAHIEVIDARDGTGWVPERILRLTEGHEITAVLCDGAGPAASLIPELEQLGIEVVVLKAKEAAQACGLIFDAIEDATLRHLGTRELTSAVQNATQRPLQDAWAWSRKGSTVNISSLCASTWAHFGALTVTQGGQPQVYNLAEFV